MRPPTLRSVPDPIPRSALVVALVLLSVLAVAGSAAIAGQDAAVAESDWPQWRGAQRDGRAHETGLLPSWPEGGPPLRWTAEGAGIGFSSVSVVGDRVFTMGDHGEGQFVLAFSRATGAELWRTRIGPSHEDERGGARSTPTFDDGLVFAIGTDGDLACLDTATGHLRWSVSLTREFGGRMMRDGGDWRFAESPLIDGDRVVVTPGGEDAMMVALDKATGEELWRAAIPDIGDAGLDGAGYSSIVISEGAGVRQYVQLVGRGVIGIEADTGRYLWGYNRIANEVANIPTPVIDGDYVVSATGYGTGAALLRLVRTGDGVDAEEVWFHAGRQMQNHHGGMVLLDGTLYLGHGHNRGFPMAVDMLSGEIIWGPERNAGTGSAAVTYADGSLYYRYQNGLMVLIEATTDGYSERGSFEIPAVAGPSWAHPVISGGILYLREQNLIHAYDIAAVAVTEEP